jgi:hypothetical protein
VGLRIAAAVASALATIVSPAHVGEAKLPTLHVAPNGRDGARCTAAVPCRSFERAYRVARPGQTVIVAPGHYGPQVIPFSGAKNAAGANVRFLARPGVVVDGDIVVYGSHVTMRGSPKRALRLHTLFSRVTSANATSHQLFENLHGATFQIWGTHYVAIRKSEWGPGIEPADSESRITPDGGVLNSYPTHILLDRIQIHDQNSHDLQTHHNGGMELVAGRDITIRNSRFYHDVVYDIEVQDFTNSGCCGMKYGNPTGVTLEGNVFEAPVLGPPYGSPNEPDGQAEVQFDPRGGGWSDWTIRRNLFEGGLATAFDGSGSFYRQFRIERNLAGRLSDCGGQGQGAVWQDNVVAQGRCGGRSLPFGYRLDDMRLVGGRGASSVAYVFRAVASGRSPARAAAMARRRRLAAPPGGWTGKAARAIVTDSLYLGGRYGPRGAHRPLVGIRLWRRAQGALER